MEKIEKIMKERIASANLTPVEDEIRKLILRKFAQSGRAPTSEEMVLRGKLSADAVNQTITKLQKADLLLKEDGKIISAYPFSVGETRHKVIFKDGHEVYALCAADALGVHFAFNEDINIISKCPECEQEIRITVKEGQINSPKPRGVVGFVSNVEKSGCTAKNLCPFINFFCSRKHLKEWMKKNPEHRNGDIYTLNEALQNSKKIFEDLLK